MTEPLVILPTLKLFTCYLLKSQIGDFHYIGTTPKPSHRLKQHNRLIKGKILNFINKKLGGAKRTAGKNPWNMILVIHGFEQEQNL
jgi:structure-specific endonuclease subunit SLX1